jgi:hypothetical protein
MNRCGADSLHSPSVCLRVSASVHTDNQLTIVIDHPQQQQNRSFPLQTLRDIADRCVVTGASAPPLPKTFDAVGKAVDALRATASSSGADSKAATGPTETEWTALKAALCVCIVVTQGRYRLSHHFRDRCGVADAHADADL